MADLIARAREQGAVAMADIAVAIEASDLPAHTIEGVARMLSEEGVDILDAAPEEADGRPEAGASLLFTGRLLRGAGLTAGRA